VCSSDLRLTITAAAATHGVLLAALISLCVGAALLVPSLAWLYILFQRSPAADSRPQG
jgi:cytochrome bd ubiquinol oxidase subunit II